MSLSEDLSLDVSAAEDAIAGLGSSFDTMAQDAANGLGSALSDAVANVDTSGFTDALTGAVDALQATPIETTLDVDTSAGLASVEDFAALAESITPDISVDADISAATDQLTVLEGLFASANTELPPVELDTSGAQSDLEGLTADLGASSGAADGAHGSFISAGSGASFLGAAVGSARGETGALRETLSGLEGTVGSAAGGLIAGAAAFTAFFAAGEKSLAADERLNVVLGATASQVKAINIGGLTGDLGELAIKAGSSGAQLKQAAANMAQIATAAGAGDQEAAKFAATISALSLRAVALNPQLGQAGDVAARLGTALSRGGRFAANFGISLTSAEINARALADTGKQAATDLTLYEKAAAGAAITTERLGTSIGTDFKKGSEQSTVQLKALEAQLIATFAQAGRPLVEPTIAALQSLAPVAESLATALGSLATAVLPAVGSAFRAIGAVLTPVVDAMGQLPPPVLAAAAALILLRNVNIESFFASLVGSAAGAADALIAFATSPVGIVIGIAAAGLALASLTGAFDSVPSHADNVKKAMDGIRQAVFANSATLAGAVQDIDNLDNSFDKYIKTQSRFHDQNQADDLKRIGLSAQELRKDLDGGAAGFDRFFKSATASGEVQASFRGVALSAKQVNDIVKEGTFTFQGHKVAVDATVISTGQLKTKNLDLVESASATSDAYRKVNKDLLDHLTETKQITPQIAALAEAQATSRNGTVDWAKALDLATNSMTKLIPFLTATQTANLQAANSFSALGQAATDAAGKLPSIGSLLGQAADDVFKFTGALDPTLITQHLGDIANKLTNFFNETAVIAAEGEQGIATALLQLGPDAGSALADALAAATPGERAALEEKITTISDAMFKIQVQLQDEANKAKVVAGAIGSGIGDELLAHFGATDFGQLSTIPTKALTDAAATIKTNNAIPGVFGDMARKIEPAWRIGAAGFKTAVDDTVASATPDPGATSASTTGWTAMGLAHAAGYRGGIKDVPVAAKEAADSTGTAAADATPTSSSFWSSMATLSKDGFKAIIDLIPTDAAAAAGKAGTDAAAEGTRHTGEMAAAGQALAGGFANGLAAGNAQAGTAGNGLAVAAAQGTRNTGGMAEAGNALGSSFAQALSATSGQANSSGLTLAQQAAAGTRNTGLMNEAGNALGSAFATALAATADQAGNAGGGLAQAAADGTRNTGAMAAAGDALGSAFANSVASHQGEARAAGQSLARAAADGAAHAGSPSEHLFTDIADRLAARFAEHVTGQQNNVAFKGGQLLGKGAADGLASSDLFKELNQGGGGAPSAAGIFAAIGSDIARQLTAKGITTPGTGGVTIPMVQVNIDARGATGKDAEAIAIASQEGVANTIRNIIRGQR